MYWSTPLLLWFIELFERNQDIPHFLNRLFKNQILLTVVIVLIIEQVLNIPFSSSDFEIVFPACQVSSQPFSSQTCTWQGSINGSYTTKFNSTIICINTYNEADIYFMRMFLWINEGPRGDAGCGPAWVVIDCLVCDFVYLLVTIFE